MPTAAVVADTNVLLSAVVGRAALRVFTVHQAEVRAAAFNAGEVEEYLPHMASKYGIPAELVMLQWKLLPVAIHPESDYARRPPRARQLVKNRDPDDAHPLALALALDLPLWTNDRDLEGLGVETVSTARFLARLESTRTRA